MDAYVSPRCRRGSLCGQTRADRAEREASVRSRVGEQRPINWDSGLDLKPCLFGKVGRLA
eukprot:11834900-Alexandrium_andersonii.AAC.1